MKLWVGAAVLAVATMLPAGGEPSPRINAPGKVDTGRTIALEADVACSPARAYETWSTQSGVVTFLGPAARIGEVGGPYTVIFFPADDPEGVDFGSAGARVLAATPGEFYAFEWVTFAGNPMHGRRAPPFAPPELHRPEILPTWVELSFTPEVSGAHVSFRHYGFGEGALWDESRVWFTGAWSGALERLARVCADRVD